MAFLLSSASLRAQQDSTASLPRGAYVTYLQTWIDTARSGADSLWQEKQELLVQAVERFDLNYLSFYDMPAVLGDSIRSTHFRELILRLKKRRPRLEIGVVLDRSAWAYFPVEHRGNPNRPCRIAQGSTLHEDWPIPSREPELAELTNAMLRMVERIYAFNAAPSPFREPLISAFTTEYEYWNDNFLRMVLPNGRSLGPFQREQAYREFLRLLREADSLGECVPGPRLRREVYHQLRRQPEHFREQFPLVQQARSVGQEAERLYYVHYFWNHRYTWERWCQDIGIYGESQVSVELWPLFAAFSGPSSGQGPDRYDWEYDAWGQRIPCGDSSPGPCAGARAGRFRHFAEGGQGRELTRYSGTKGLDTLEDTYQHKWNRARRYGGLPGAGVCDSSSGWSAGKLRLGGYMYFHLDLLQRKLPPDASPPSHRDTLQHLFTSEYRLRIYPSEGKGPLQFDLQGKHSLYAELRNMHGAKIRGDQIRTGHTTWDLPRAGAYLLSLYTPRGRRLQTFRILR